MIQWAWKNVQMEQLMEKVLLLLVNISFFVIDHQIVLNDIEYGLNKYLHIL